MDRGRRIYSFTGYCIGVNQKDSLLVANSAGKHRHAGQVEGIVNEELFDQLFCIIYYIR